MIILNSFLVSYCVCLENGRMCVLVINVMLFNSNSVLIIGGIMCV